MGDLRAKGVVWAMVLLAACEVRPSPDEAEEPAPPGGLAIAITQPKAGQGPVLLAGKRLMTGSVQVEAGVTLDRVEVAVGPLVFGAKVSGATFQAQIDTRDPSGQPLFACNEATSLLAVAIGRAGEQAVAELPVEIDDCAPVLKVVAPLPGSTHVGRVVVQGSVQDKRLKHLHLRLDGETLGQVELPGPFTVEIDRGTAPSAELELAAVAEDQAGNQSTIVMPVTVLRRPDLIGDSGSVGAEPWWGAVRHQRLADLDGDGVVDLLLATAGGLVLRRGVPVLDQAGVPTGQATGQYDVPPEGTPGRHVPGADLRRLEVADLDGDGDPDVLAAGVGEQGAAQAWALLTHEGRVRRVDVRELSGVPLSTALGDLDGDGQHDFLVGTDSWDSGLVRLRLLTTPTCGALPCGGKVITNVAKVFAAVEPAPQQGVAGIAAIAVGDFFQDPAQYPDVCVGEAGRPMVSCYRNRNGDGVLDHAIDGFQVADCANARLIAPVEWTGDGKLDLVVASDCGKVRFLRGNGDGTFTFVPGVYRQVTLDGPPVSLLVAPIGPGGSLCVVIAQADGTLVLVPVVEVVGGTPGSTPAIDPACQPCYLLGSNLAGVEVLDVDGDGDLDLVGLNGATGTPNSANGKGNGQFGLPWVLRMCALSASGSDDMPTRQDVAAMAIGQFAGDAKPDLVVLGKRARSQQPGLSGACPLPGSDKPLRKPAWPLLLYQNQGGSVAVSARAGEVAPHATGQLLKAGVASTCPSVPMPFGAPVAVSVADLDGDGRDDLAVVRDEAAYPLGEQEPGQPDGCPPCEWKESKEVDNHFGLDSPDEYDPSRCCRAYAEADTAKAKPLTGYGGGAPLARASLFLLPAGSTPQPFGLGPQHTIVAPGLVQPSWAQAAGRDPVGVATGDYDGDGKQDVLTVMPGVIEDLGVLASRARLFLGDGKGRVQPMPLQGDLVPLVDSGTGRWTQNAKVSYRIVGDQPNQVVGGPGAHAYVLAKTHGQISVLRGHPAQKLQRLADLPVGPGATGLASGDLDQDGTLDLVAAVDQRVGMLQGLLAGFATIELVPALKKEFRGVAVGDVTGDGLLDAVLLTPGAVEVLVGDGMGGFVPYGGQIAVLPDSRRLALADLQGDGCPDVIVQSLRGVTVVPNQGCAAP